jgi:phospholipase/lecithinase/hemolysin
MEWSAPGTNKFLIARFRSRALTQEKPAVTKNKKYSRLGFAALVMATAVLMSGCGGGGDDDVANAVALPPGGVKLQVVSFGDSLSDVGTYGPIAKVLFQTGGRFTNNPGKVWTQLIAEYYGDTLAPAHTVAMNGTVSSHLGAFGYAQGGALTVCPQNLTCSTQLPLPTQGAVTLPQLSVVDQVALYLSEHDQKFNDHQLVLVQGGPNDIMALVTQAAAAGQQISDTATAVKPSVTALVGAVGAVAKAGAKHIVVVNTPDLGKTPLGVATGAYAQYSALSTAFNIQLNEALKNAGLTSVIYADAAKVLDDAFATPHLFTHGNTETKCDLTAIATALAGPSGTPDPTAVNALMCAEKFQKKGIGTYMFADWVHPTTELHALFAQKLEAQIHDWILGIK